MPQIVQKLIDPARMPVRNLLIAVMACGFLAACDETSAPEAAPEAEDAQVEQSPIAEVLEGSVSDGMIGLDELRSQPPLAAGEEDGAEEEAGDGAGSAED